MKKLAIITTHPIQYYSPVYKLLSERKNVELKVFYTWEPESYKLDKGFMKEVVWDIPVLQGYHYEFVPNGGNQQNNFWSVRNPTLRQRIQDFAPDIILVVGWNFLSHLQVLRYFSNHQTTLAFRGDSTLLDEVSFLKTAVRRLFLKWVYGHIDVALYVGECSKNYFLTHGVRQDKLIYSPHAIDNDRFDKSVRELNPQRDELRRQFNISNDQIVFLFVGKFQRKKDPQTLLNAFGKLRKGAAALIMVGTGDLEEVLKEMSRGNPDIHFPGFMNQTELPTYYCIADVFCLPSIGPGETWGLSINEAMACSKPVIVSDKCGGAKDLVKPGVNGYIFKAADQNGLSHFMERFLNNRSLAREMGKHSREIISSFSFDKVVKSIENLTLKVK